MCRDFNINNAEKFFALLSITKRLRKPSLSARFQLLQVDKIPSVQHHLC